MSDAAANIDVDSAGGVVAPKLPGGATLPFPPTPSASIAGRTLQESTYAQRVTPPRLHEDSPNIVIVLIDDAGPGLPTTFGGEVRTATMDRICAEGVSYNRFHTTAMCSPTRASLLTGRNHHEIGNGQIADVADLAAAEAGLEVRDPGVGEAPQVVRGRALLPRAADRLPLEQVVGAAVRAGLGHAAVRLHDAGARADEEQRRDRRAVGQLGEQQPRVARWARTRPRRRGRRTAPGSGSPPARPSPGRSDRTRRAARGRHRRPARRPCAPC